MGQLNWRVEDWKKNVAWSDESLFLLRQQVVGSEFNSMEPWTPPTFFSTVQAVCDGVLMLGMFSWHTLGLLIPINNGFNATAYLTIVANHVPPFIATIPCLLTSCEIHAMKY